MEKFSDPRKPKVAILGGSFNPPHVFHLIAAIYVLETKPVNEVWLMPVFEHVFQKKLAPFKDRLALCSALIHPYRPRLAVSDFEAREGATGYTIDTLRDLKLVYPETEFVFVAGTDIRHEIHKWKDFDAIESEFGVIWIGREGYNTEGCEIVLPNVSSTMLRERLKTGEDVSAYIPKRVLDEIELRGLYKTP